MAQITASTSVFYMQAVGQSRKCCFSIERPPVASSAVSLSACDRLSANSCSRVRADLCQLCLITTIKLSTNIQLCHHQPAACLCNFLFCCYSLQNPDPCLLSPAAPCLQRQTFSFQLVTCFHPCVTPAPTELCCSSRNITSFNPSLLFCPRSLSTMNCLLSTTL